MSSVKYATEDTIRSLIILIKEELASYATKKELRSEIDKLNDISSGFSLKMVDSLPDVGESNIVYLVYNDDGKGNNLYDEYFWNKENQSFELFGSVEANVEIAEQYEIDLAYDDKIYPNLKVTATIK